ncbi:MAG: hypothetical protein WDN76_03645 [Alphaproteobacteria bacterium]
MSDRPRTRAFVRRDRFNRFVSALVYVPKDRFNSILRAAIGKGIGRGLWRRGGSVLPDARRRAAGADSLLIQNIDRTRSDPNAAALDAKIAALTRNWSDQFNEALHADRR